ncbi:MAG: DNA recombination/repair protein RecA, partial [Armatimonadota bacterium]|nr:DNA recombination/repair protein RecA [Armatimonadota bacterium]
DIIQKSGSWYSHGETRIGQGRENAKQFLEENPEMMDQLEATIRGDEKAAEILTVGASE